MRERATRQVGQFGRKTRLWSALAALTAALVLSVALGSSAGAQPSDPPHWFFGIEYDNDEGATIRVLNADGEEIDRTAVDDNNQWTLLIAMGTGAVTFQIQSGDVTRATEPYVGYERGGLTRIERSDFTVVVEQEPEPEQEPEQEPDDEVEEPDAAGESTQVRVIARVAPADSARPGQIEFGLYVDGVDAPWNEVRAGDAAPMFLPPARYFPATYPDHNRWLRSTLTELGNGCVARVIARTAPAGSARPGQIEFGLYVDGVDAPWNEVRAGDAAPMFLPPARYFPNPHPDHSRWLRSTLTEIPCSSS